MDFDEWWEESGAWEMRKIRDIGEAAWNAAIQSRLNQNTVSIEAAPHYGEAISTRYQQERDRINAEIRKALDDMPIAPSQEVMLQYPAAGCVIGEPQIQAAPSQEPRAEDVEWAIPAPDICFDPDKGAEGWAYSYGLLEHTLNINRTAPSQEPAQSLCFKCGHPKHLGECVNVAPKHGELIGGDAAAQIDDLKRQLAKCCEKLAEANLELKAAPSQEPVGTVGQLFDERVIAKSGLSEDRLVYLTPPDAAAQIAYLERSDKAAWRKANEHQEQIAKLQASLNAAQNVADDSFKQIADLQRSEELCRNAADRLRVELDQLTAAARMAYDVLGLIKLNTPPSKLVDECLVKLRDALGEVK